MRPSSARPSRRSRRHRAPFRRTLPFGGRGLRAGTDHRQAVLAGQLQLLPAVHGAGPAHCGPETGKRIPQDDNPLYPKAIFAAFLAASQAQGACDQVDLVLLKEFGHQIADALPNVYQDINRYLGAQCAAGYPLGRHAPPTTSGPGRRRRQRRGSADVAATPPSPATRRRTVPGPPSIRKREIPDDVFTQIANSLLSHPWANPGASRYRHPGPGASICQYPGQTSAQIIQALTQLQRGDFDPQQFPGIEPHQADSDRHGPAAAHPQHPADRLVATHGRHHGRRGGHALRRTPQ